MLDERAAVLQTISPDSRGVRELVKKLRWKTTRVVSLLKTMEKEGLIDFSKSSNSRRGRPKKIVAPTVLGNEFLETFQQCQRKVVQMNYNDVKSAVYQALLAKKLEELNISPYQRFMELNTLALKIRTSITKKDSTQNSSNL